MKRRHARISEHAARHWGELSQREGRVYICLMFHRNELSGRCNPSRSAIIEFTGLLKSHVSEAIRGLEAKDWIAIDADGYHFPKVPELGTKVPETGTEPDVPEVPESGTKVPGSGTKVPEVGTLLNKEFLTTNKQRSNSEARADPPIVTIPEPDIKPEPDRSVVPVADGRRPRAVPIPANFPLTDEMRIYLAKHFPFLDPDAAHLDFVEYWTNLTRKNRLAIDWPLRWKKGMKQLDGWHLRDNPNRATNGRRFEAGRDRRGCSDCHFAGMIKATKDFTDADYWGSVDCPTCRPDQFAELYESITGKRFDAAA